MHDPFGLLGIEPAASETEIKKAYLKKVQAHPPERDPERFQAIHAAYEAIKTHRDRLRFELFAAPEPDLEMLLESCLRPGTPRRPSVEQFRRVLIKSLEQYNP